MNVGICGGDDAQSVASGECEVAVHIALGVDDDGLARSGTTDQVRELCQLWVGDLSNEHDVLRATTDRWAFADCSSAFPTCRSQSRLNGFAMPGDELCNW